MIVPIHEKVRLRSEQNQWVVDHLSGTTWKAYSFHMNPIAALKSAQEDDIRLIPDALTFKQAILDMKKISILYNKIYKEIFPPPRKRKRVAPKSTKKP